MTDQPLDEPPRQREEGRPDPEELLRRYSLRDSDLGASPPATTAAGGQTAPQAGGYQRRRGRLRVYLGAVAGAGDRRGYRVRGNTWSPQYAGTDWGSGDRPAQEGHLPWCDTGGDGYRG